LTSYEVQRLITFVEGAKRGICGGLRPGEHDAAEDEGVDDEA
jgi:hypothetical protein